MADHTRTYTIVLERSPAGWRGTCLELPRCVRTGQSRRETYQAVKDALRADLLRRLATGQPIPSRHLIVKRPRFDLRALAAPVHELR